jgi:hypothetical protein
VKPPRGFSRRKRKNVANLLSLNAICLDMVEGIKRYNIQNWKEKGRYYEDF